MGGVTSRVPSTQQLLGLAVKGPWLAHVSFTNLKIYLERNCVPLPLIKVTSPDGLCVRPERNKYMKTMTSFTPLGVLRASFPGSPR